VRQIIVHVRLPRTLACALAGAALAVAGVLLQAVLNNAMASPNIIGVNAGAGFFALLASSLLPASAAAVPAAAFLGALGAAMLIYLLALRAGLSRTTLVLAGIAVGGMLTAGVSALRLLFPDAAVGSDAFMAGGFSGAAMERLLPALPFIIAGLALALILAPDVNVLCLGEESAAGLGLNVGRTRFLWPSSPRPAGGRGRELCGTFELRGPAGAPHNPPLHGLRPPAAHSRPRRCWARCS
jgi:iron complex transport system permease protein